MCGKYINFDVYVTGGNQSAISGPADAGSKLLGLIADASCRQVGILDHWQKWWEQLFSFAKFEKNKKKQPNHIIIYVYH